MKYIPNILTCCNLLSGCASIAMVVNHQLDAACYLIFIAAIFDFSDGFTARKLNAYSPLGKQLDSLADVVSFGVAPGIIMYLFTQGIALTAFEETLAYFALLVPVFAALRLANFNIDEGQSDSFTGLPSPASALFLASIPLITHEWIRGMFQNVYIALPIVMIVSLSMVLKIKLFSLKFKEYSWRPNREKYLLLIITPLLFIFVGFAALPLAIFSYVLLSVTSSKKQQFNNSTI